MGRDHAGHGQESIAGDWIASNSEEQMTWFLAQLRCPGCGETRFFDRAGLANWLKERGRLRRESRPSVDLMLELGRLDAANCTCSDCGATGLCLEPPAEEEGDWGDARRCEACREPIDPLRLEVFPDSTRCTGCQQKAERGEDASADDIEYCPHCGAPMQLTMQQRGVTRYSLVCSECGRR